MMYQTVSSSIFSFQWLVLLKEVRKLICLALYLYEERALEKFPFSFHSLFWHGIRSLILLIHASNTSTPKMNASIENTATGSSTVVDDISSPYFPHNGDSPIIMLVTHLSLVEKKLSIVVEINDHGFDSPKQSRIYEWSLFTTLEIR